MLTVGLDLNERFCGEEINSLTVLTSETPDMQLLCPTSCLRCREWTSSYTVSQKSCVNLGLQTQQVQEGRRKAPVTKAWSEVKEQLVVTHASWTASSENCGVLDVQRLR